MDENKKCIHECVCGCHGPNITAMHFMACCDKCDTCGRLIKDGQMEDHKNKCHGG